MNILTNALNAYDGDVFVHHGAISRAAYDNLSKLLEIKTTKKSKVCLILITYGGDPNAAYRMARALNHHYCRKVEILIPDMCKSAGTLLCVGASRLIIGDRGELGPLDIQLSKPDEIFESMSGLNIIQALAALDEQMLTSFNHYLVDIRGRIRLSTKLAAEIASKLSESLVGPIASKIDPLTLGEHQRAMQIGYNYGDRLQRLAQSLNQNALMRLVSGYPSHEFVIDRKEATEIFRNVTAPDQQTIGLYFWARQYVESVQMPVTPQIFELSLPTTPGDQNGNEDGNHEGASGVVQSEGAIPDVGGEPNDTGPRDEQDD